MVGDFAVSAALSVSPPWCGEVDSFVARLATARMRPIAVQDLPAPGTLFGAWVPTAIADYIFLSERLTGAHRAHVLLHEVGHLLMDHRVGLSETLSGVAPGLAQRMLARHGHDTEQERQAEMFASLMMTTTQQQATEWAEDPRGRRASTVFG